MYIYAVVIPIPYSATVQIQHIPTYTKIQHIAIYTNIVICCECNTVIIHSPKVEVSIDCERIDVNFHKSQVHSQKSEYAKCLITSFDLLTCKYSRFLPIGVVSWYSGDSRGYGPL